MSTFTGSLWLLLTGLIVFNRVVRDRRRVDWTVAAIPCSFIAIDSFLGASW